MDFTRFDKHQKIEERAISMDNPEYAQVVDLICKQFGRQYTAARVCQMICELNLSRKKGDTLWALADPQQMLRFMLICYKITKDVPSDDVYWMDETHVDPRNTWRRKGWSNKGQRY
ncbi:hypothetical protein J8273_3830 [Carpediemonas membranifera]|uniref:Uncharacterized protein n=1 Tax=Carpediemonas membranifera TaxID=201153 RepID=A0A8J6B599_9EUKA|nr:hypothetical protein J8273_3830 [Carpediemonas membranifera]|eukprot:KAG9394579.1 hypothetical protein J8273_3830 [Carpediemonas membranifera]